MRMTENNQVKYIEGEKDKQHIVDSMKKYVVEKQELDKFLENMITPLIQKRKLNILDACCGIGHLDFFLSQISPESHFLGIDKTPYLIEEAKILCRDLKNVEFRLLDVANLSREYKKEFDISICWKTVSWLPRYEPVIRELMQVTKESVFVSSLFYSEDIDFEIKVREYQSEAGRDGFNMYYNVYSYPRFEDFCLKCGAKKVVPYDFEMGIDIPKPKKNFMGTYTLKLENGKRIQISGAVLMSWKVIRIDL